MLHHIIHLASSQSAREGKEVSLFSLVKEDKRNIGRNACLHPVSLHASYNA
jgi:hypothetical protein